MEEKQVLLRVTQTNGGTTIQAREPGRAEMISKLFKNNSTDRPDLKLMDRSFGRTGKFLLSNPTSTLIDENRYYDQDEELIEEIEEMLLEIGFKFISQSSERVNKNGNTYGFHTRVYEISSTMISRIQLN